MSGWRDETAYGLALTSQTRERERAAYPTRCDGTAASGGKHAHVALVYRLADDGREWLTCPICGRVPARERRERKPRGGTRA